MQEHDAPLYRDALALCGVLLDELEPGATLPTLRTRLTSGAIRLLDAVVLALGGFDRTERLVEADAELRTLRTHLLLAHELSLVDEETYLAFAEQCDRIGRQIGGWLKQVERVPS